MQHLEVSGAVRPLKWSLGVKGLNNSNIDTERNTDTNREHVDVIDLFSFSYTERK